MEDGAVAVADPPPLDQLDPLLETALECCASVMRAMGRSAAEACPVTGRDLDDAISALAAKLTADASLVTMREAGRQAERHLASWGAQTAEHLKGKANEVKELMMMLARTAESVGERDQLYSSQFSGLTADLKTVANLDDITQVRQRVLKKAAEMKICLDTMAEDGRQSLEEMHMKISDYERKLREAQELASQDPLTGLANRRGLEARMARWARQQRTFCVLMLDLNRFKELNDRHGHQAGDDLLRLFAVELMTRVRAEDIVGRWGGDEFLIVIGYGFEIAQRQVERIRRWVFGEYTLPGPRGRDGINVVVEAAIGLAEWVPGETLEELLARADAAMYEDRRAGRMIMA